MVKRFITFVSREIRGLGEAAYLLAVFTFFSQILALIRDRMLAHTFGAGFDLDMYYAAFRIPDISFALIASLLSVWVILPEISKRIVRSNAEAKAFLSRMLALLTTLLIVSSVALFFLLPTLLPFIFKGAFMAGRGDELILLSRILLLSPLILGISNFIASITQYEKRFAIYALSPFLYNLGIIGGVLFAREYGVIAVVWGVIAGCVLHLFIQIPSILRSALRPGFSWKWQPIEIKEVFKESVPRTFILASNQIIFTILVSLVSLFGIGAISVFTLAYNIHAIPQTIIALSFASAAFPVLAKLYHEGKKEEFLAKVIVPIRHILFWAIPASFIFIVFRAHIVRLILGTGAFDWTDTRLTAACLAAFSLFIIFGALNTHLMRVLYVLGKTKQAFIASFIGSLVTIVFAFGFSYLAREGILMEVLGDIFRIRDISLGVLVIPALSFGIGSVVNLILIVRTIRKAGLRVFAPVKKETGKICIMAIIGAIISYIGLQVFAQAGGFQTVSGLMFQAIPSALLGLLAFIAIGLKLKSETLSEVLAACHLRSLPPPHADEELPK